MCDAWIMTLNRRIISPVATPPYSAADRAPMPRHSRSPTSAPHSRTNARSAGDTSPYEPATSPRGAGKVSRCAAIAAPA